jgi:hypothetical protein
MMTDSRQASRIAKILDPRYVQTLTEEIEAANRTNPTGFTIERLIAMYGKSPPPGDPEERLINAWKGPLYDDIDAWRTLFQKDSVGRFWDCVDAWRATRFKASPESPQ